MRNIKTRYLKTGYTPEDWSLAFTEEDKE